MKILKCLLFIFAAALFSGCQPTGQQFDYYLLVGTYTHEGSQGIYVYKFDSNDGSLVFASKTAGVKNPSYLAVSPNQKYVYAVNELKGGQTGYVSAFSFNRKTGELTFLNRQSSEGTAPCYVAVDQTGNYIFVANYSSGSFSEFPVNNDGTLQPAILNIEHHGSSVNKKRQSSSHVHCTHFTPDNNYLIVNDLGTDYVSQYAFNAETGKLSNHPVRKYKIRPGSGPRHITFTPNGKYAYLVTEMAGSVVAFHYADNRLHHIQTISAVPKTYDGSTTGAEVRVSPDGRFLYVSLRKNLNKIAIFSINRQSGKLTQIGWQATGGVQPRNFMIGPAGRYLLVANMASDNVVVFKRNPSTGMLQSTSIEINVSMPVCLVMIPAK